MSSVPLFEYVNLVGHYNNLIYQERIDPRLLARGYTEDQIKQMKARRNSRNTMEIVSCNLHIKGDLERWEHPYFNYYLTLYDQFNKHGTMPYPGPVTEQPAKVIEVFHILENLSMERDEKIRRDQEEQAKKAQRRVRK